MVLFVFVIMLVNLDVLAAPDAIQSAMVRGGRAGARAGRAGLVAFWQGRSVVEFAAAPAPRPCQPNAEHVGAGAIPNVYAAV